MVYPASLYLEPVMQGRSTAACKGVRYTASVITSQTCLSNGGAICVTFDGVAKCVNSLHVSKVAKGVWRVVETRILVSSKEWKKCRVERQNGNEWTGLKFLQVLRILASNHAG